MLPAIRPSSLAVSLLAAAVVVLSACDDPVAGVDRCESGADCPSGLCIEGVCAEDLVSIDAESEAGASDVSTDLSETDTDAGVSDGGEPDASQPDVPQPDAGEDVEPTDVAPDAPIDVAEDATPDVDRDTAGNACGGTVVLPAEPGAPCGACDAGVWVCDGIERLVCDPPAAPPFNACGGCGSLDGAPGDACGPCGLDRLVCDGEDRLRCSGSTDGNACGGCDALPNAPGDPCGECGGGAYRCDGENAVVCDDDGGLNGCGGCGPLSGGVGAPCGWCSSGTWVCDGDDVSCVGDEGPSALNACGGCGTLSAAPGTACGECGSGTYECVTIDAVDCVGNLGEAALNACGGCDALSAEPGDACGTCDSGVVACRGANNVACEGDDGAEAFNDCGGCSELPDEGDACTAPDCATGGEWTCASAEAMACECAATGPCGNGVFEPELGEACEDGNVAEGDGCNADCEVEGEPNDSQDCDDPFLLPPNGFLVFDTCDLDDDANAQPGVSTCSVNYDSNDAIMRLTLEERSEVTLYVRDADDSVAIDTRVYVRARCGARDSEIACHDDMPCGEAIEYPNSGCLGGEQPRESYIDGLVLDAGTYTVIVDTQEYRIVGGSTFSCGEVLLQIYSRPVVP